MPLTESVTNVLGKITRAYLSDGALDVQLDIINSFSESHQIDVTQHAIQSGADITDNIDPKTEDYSLDCILTDDDWDVLNPTNFINPSIKERIDSLILFKETKSILTYYGQEDEISDVVISSMTKSKSKDVGAGIRLSIGLKKINVATAQTVDAPVIQQNGVNNKGQSPKGTTSKDATATPKKRVSIAKKIIP
jgi:hypothetical protein